ncbi:TVG0128375 [Thermoplasma volcanium GSS1]|uniref:TVG0128375 protein n=1 Tax=Thermoplasma volcanium (strain ATCC 51530 / DSM 4299 / JCM 9571 / NBRC 15438 / GSS1) TaxID=273116 RepID=Q97CH9_THEVO|nr:DUF302 domain-containing protein [Thermoplasma volcanium]BAB59264.1 TVG0128375 [Thermoplasma volcanium GSS1]
MDLKYESPVGYSETLSQLKNSIEKNGMKIVTEIDPQQNLKNAGISIEPQHIFEIFNPVYAKSVFDQNILAGIVPPLRIFVYVSEGKTWMMRESAIEKFRPYNIKDIPEKVEGIMEKIINDVIKNKVQDD